MLKPIFALLLTLAVTGCVSQPKVDKETTSAEDISNELLTTIDMLSQDKEDLETENLKLKEDLSALEEELDNLKKSLEKAETATNTPPSVVSVAETVVELIKFQDFAGLSTYIHPTSGVRFSPYPYINTSTDQIMTSSQVSAFATDTTVYNWGTYDGSGEPIDMTPLDYFNEFVYDEDYATPEMMAWNSIIGTGNMINNLATVYPSADFIEFHFSGFNSQYNGMDWSSLTLVFEQSGSNWYLIGVIHGQWTI